MALRTSQAASYARLGRRLALAYVLARHAARQPTAGNLAAASQAAGQASAHAAALYNLLPAVRAANFALYTAQAAAGRAAGYCPAYGIALAGPGAACPASHGGRCGN